MRRVIFILALIWSAVADIPKEEERSQVAEFLMNLRESVNPPASNMLLMVSFKLKFRLCDPFLCTMRCL
uniref:Conotoxin n=1 Tax=Mesocestoides corti TaxID=53468 RepID=A0A5K3FCN0_MESCO